MVVELGSVLNIANSESVFGVIQKKILLLIMTPSRGLVVSLAMMEK